MSALQVDVENLGIDINYIKSVDLNYMMRTTLDKDAAEEVEIIDTNVKKDKEMKKAREEFREAKGEHHIFGNRSYLGGTIVQPMILAAHVESSAEATVGLYNTTTNVSISGFDA